MIRLHPNRTVVLMVLFIVALALVDGLTAPRRQTLGATTTRALQIQRGGASAALNDYTNNDEIDAYIEALVAGVEDDSEDVPPSTKALPVAVDSEPTTTAKLAQSRDESDQHDDVPPIKGDTNPGDDEHEIRNQDAVNVPENKSDAVRSTSVGIDSSSGTEPTTTTISPRAPYYRRPNALYRFLLDKGRLGHMIVMFFVWMAEFIQTFLPPLANAFSLLATAIFGAESLRGTSRLQQDVDSTKHVNDQYVAFVDNRRAIRGKHKTKANQKADQEAADQLRQVGSVVEARYRHLSQDFMKRHGLGPYNDEDATATITDADELRAADDDDKVRRQRHVVDEHEDTNWVVEALTTDKLTPIKKKRISSSKPSLDLGVSTSGVTVGVSFSLGGGTAAPTTATRTTSRSRRRKTLIAAATSRVSEKKPMAGPRVSDREGGGGVLGRIRDFGANNLVSRSLLGAYPGDALPPPEAANANGLAEFAIKYGYGDWSDEEDDATTASFGASASAKRSKKRRKRSPSSHGPSSEKGGTARSSIHPRKRRTSLPPHLSLEVDSSLSRTSTGSMTSPRRLSKLDHTNKKSNKMVLLPTERLREKDAELKKEVLWKQKED